MKRAAIILSVIAILLTRGQAVAQETAEEESIHYEKLKVLKPLLGEWHSVQKLGNGGQAEWLHTVSWAPSKKMLVGKVQMRFAPAGTDLADEDWEHRGRMFWAWSPGSESIQLVTVGEHWGFITHSEAKVDEKKGVITYPDVHGTGGGSSERVDTVTATEWKTEITNRKNAEGEELDDMGWTFTKVK
jgi:hypothetical protein